MFVQRQHNDMGSEGFKKMEGRRSFDETRTPALLVCFNEQERNRFYNTAVSAALSPAEWRELKKMYAHAVVQAWRISEARIKLDPHESSAGPGVPEYIALSWTEIPVEHQEEFVRHILKHDQYRDSLIELTHHGEEAFIEAFKTSAANATVSSERGQGAEGEDGQAHEAGEHEAPISREEYLARLEEDAETRAYLSNLAAEAMNELMQSCMRLALLEFNANMPARKLQH
jgi:hypothetical protein